jgi:hypothetical protein
MKRIYEITGISKLEIIEALGENTTALKEKKKELIERLFEIQKASEKQIQILRKKGLIDISEWGVSFLERRYNDYMMYDREIIDQYGGRYDGGDFNEWVPPTNYEKLLEFVLKSTDIIKGMQSELADKLENINAHLPQHGQAENYENFKTSNFRI